MNKNLESGNVESVLNEEMSCLVDWLSFTIQDTQKYSVENIISDLLKIDKDKFTDLKKGHHGYLSQKAYDNIRIYSNGLEGMGIHVQMSGSGCRLFEGTYPGTWKDFFREIKNYGGKPSRLDMAIDDKKGYLDLDLMIEKLNKREIVTKFTKYRKISDGDFDYAKEGKTLYLGSMKSDIFFRIYDKSYEQMQKGMDSTKNEFEKNAFYEVGMNSHWVRFELQMRNEIACNMFEQIVNSECENLFTYVAGVIKDKVRFVDPNPNDENKWRWEESLFWKKFMKGVEKLKISKRPKKKTLEEVMNHFEKQWAPTMATIFTFYEGDYSELTRMIYQGKERMKSKHYNLLNSCK